MREIILLTTVWLIMGTFAEARQLQAWRPLEEADLIVIAKPTGTKDTAERLDFPGIENVGTNGQVTTVQGVGVETSFQVVTVFKGDRDIKTFVLFHLREVDSTPSENGPCIVSIDLTGKREYLLYLMRGAKGRYEPISGFTDSAFSAKVLEDAWQPNYIHDLMVMERIGTFGPRAVVLMPDILQALDHWAPVVQHAAVTALGQIGPQAKNAIPRLEKVFLGNDHYLRVEAASALLKIDPTNTVSIGVLKSELRYPHPHIRLGAIQALVESTLPKVEVIRELEGVNHDENAQVREAATTAIDQLKSKKAGTPNNTPEDIRR